MMARIHPGFLDELRQEMDHHPINVLGQMQAKEVVMGEPKTYINGTWTKAYTHDHQPARKLRAQMGQLLEKLGIRESLITGARAVLKIGGKTVAVAQNVSYNIGPNKNGIQTIPNGRLTLHSSNDAETKDV